MIIRFFLKTFNTNGQYQEDWKEITQYVDSNKLGDISQKIDGSDYDIGVKIVDSISITLNNTSGLFSDSSSIKSLFPYKRSESLIKITVNDLYDYSYCGITVAGNDILYENDIVVFEGIIDDSDYSETIETSQITFRLLGKNFIFSRVLTPISEINNGQTVSQIISTCLNQNKIKNILSIGTINPANDIVVDNVANFKDKPIKTLLDELLLLSNSVLLIENNTIHVTPQIATTDVKYSFYGPASELNLENISSIDDYMNGLNRTFNVWSWKNVDNCVVKNYNSIEKYGARNKELSCDSITNYNTQLSVLNNLNIDYSLPKKEFNLTTPLNSEVINLKLLDKVKIDYPIVYKAAFNEELPTWGKSIWNNFIWPIGEYILNIEYVENFKIIAKKINLKKGTVEFKLREI